MTALCCLGFAAFRTKNALMSAVWQSWFRDALGHPEVGTPPHLLLWPWEITGAQTCPALSPSLEAETGKEQAGESQFLTFARQRRAWIFRVNRPERSRGRRGISAVPKDNLCIPEEGQLCAYLHLCSSASLKTKGLLRLLKGRLFQRWFQQPLSQLCVCSSRPCLMRD